MSKVQRSLDRSAHRHDGVQTPANVPKSDAAGTEDRSYAHLLAILSVSSGMVGVCLTAIGLIGITKTLGRVETIVDDLLAVSSVLFMIAAVFSFLGMRSHFAKTWHNFARTLDVLFCFGLVLVVVATVLLTFMVL